MSVRPMGYTGSIDTVRRFIQTLKPQKQSLQKLTVRFETAPGQQAQADWAYCGRFVDPQQRTVSIYLFVCVLSFSRYMFIEFTHSMNLHTLIGCHLNAFDYFGGWPQSILYDNMKQVRLSQQQFNPLFLDFINHYGIVPKTHRICRPRTKGKVERMVDYVKDNFLNGRSFVDLADLNHQGRHWLEAVANVRLHSTTRERPIDLLAKENLSVTGSVARYQLSQKATRKVDSSGFVRYARSRYSVPPENVGKTVMVEQAEQKILIRSGDLIIAEHPKAPRAGSCMTQAEHVEALWKLSLNRPAPAAPHWEVTFNEAVAVADLSQYEEVGR